MGSLNVPTKIVTPAINNLVDETTYIECNATGRKYKRRRALHAIQRMLFM